LTVGNSSRVCSVVNATIVPAVTAVPLPATMRNPATRYTSAGVTPRNVCTTAKNDCPVMAWRTWRSTCRAFSAR
jgi:hypothetical protein